MTSRIFIAAISMVAVACMHTVSDDNAMLWEYYEETEADPKLALSVRDKVSNPDMKEFLLGLSFRDAYRQKSDLRDFVEADNVFKQLIARNSKVYYGYLGRGLMFTEAGMRLTEKAQDTLRQVRFDSARIFIQKAIDIVKGKKANNHPDLPMLYFYIGKNEFYRYRTYEHNNKINLNAIYFLDSAIQKKEGFYKAYLRSAQYLNQYAIVAKSNDSNPQIDEIRKQEADSSRKEYVIYKTEELREKLPMVHDRLRYLFDECLRLSKRPEVYLSMAEANLTYSRFERLTFLDAAENLKDNPAEIALKIRQEKSEIYYTDLKSYSGALKHYDWLQPSDPGVQLCAKSPCPHNAHHWVAICWSLFQTDQADSAYSVLAHRIEVDPGHSDQYWYAKGMMLNQGHHFSDALASLQKARASAERLQRPHGYICFELAKVHLSLNKKKQALELLQYLTDTYDGANDPYYDETWTNAYYMIDLFKLSE
jgi:hypothetical protein